MYYVNECPHNYRETSVCVCVLISELIPALQEPTGNKELILSRAFAKLPQETTRVFPRDFSILWFCQQQVCSDYRVETRDPNVFVTWFPACWSALKWMTDAAFHLGDGKGWIINHKPFWVRRKKKKTIKFVCYFLRKPPAQLLKCGPIYHVLPGLVGEQLQWIVGRVVLAKSFLDFCLTCEGLGANWCKDVSHAFISTPPLCQQTVCEANWRIKEVASSLHDGPGGSDITWQPGRPPERLLISVWPLSIRPGQTRAAHKTPAWSHVFLDELRVWPTATGSETRWLICVGVCGARTADGSPHWHRTKACVSVIDGGGFQGVLRGVRSGVRPATEERSGAKWLWHERNLEKYPGEGGRGWRWKNKLQGKKDAWDHSKTTMTDWSFISPAKYADKQ